MAERILVVEDNPAVLEAYAATLGGGGYEVVQAPSGKLAQEILRTSSLDVVITDLRMPEIGGLDVLRIAKSTDPEIIVILVTGFPTVETAVEAMKVGEPRDERSEEHTSELQSPCNLVCRLLLEKKKTS